MLGTKFVFSLIQSYKNIENFFEKAKIVQMYGRA